MKENAKFLKCPICDNIIELIDGDVQHITCCGRKMEKKRPGYDGYVLWLCIRCTGCYGRRQEPAG